MNPAEEPPEESSSGVIPNSVALALLLWNEPENIRDEWIPECARAQTALSLNRIPHRMTDLQIESAMAENPTAVSNLLKTSEGPHAGIRLAFRIQQTPGLKVSPEIRERALTLLASTI